MPRNAYFRELDALKDEILLMASMVTAALNDAVEALKKRDLATAQRLIEEDRIINTKRYELEDRCLTVIATQQPMASDMRLLAAVLEISTELERIGDYAKGIGRIIIYLGSEPPVKSLVDIPLMSEKALDMLRRSLDAFINQDVAAARAIPLEDDEVDALYNKVHRDLLEIIRQDPSRLERANYLLWAAHNLERAADRVTNICERVIYMVTGELVEVDAERALAGLS